LNALANYIRQGDESNDWMFIVDSVSTISTKDKINNLARQIVDTTNPVKAVLISIAFVIGSIIFFPISIVASVLAVLFGLPVVILLLIFNPGIFSDNDGDVPNDDRTGFNPDSDFVNLLFVLGTIVSPLIAIVLIIFAIINLFTTIISILTPDQAPAPCATNDVVYRLGMVIDSPIGNIVEIVQNMFRPGNTMMNDNDETELESGLNTLFCKNEALLNALPF
jgi:hypothetical protein